MPERWNSEKTRSPRSLRDAWDAFRYEWHGTHVAFIALTDEGIVYSSASKVDKRRMAVMAQEGVTVLVAWPGRYAQDIFVLDNPEDVLAA